MEMDFYSAIESVREKIERGEKYYALLNDKPKWNQYCASLYAIEDAQCAIEAYTSYEFPTDIKGKYLYIYGLLQALFLQQDAANGISTALLGKKIDFKQEYPSLFEIREIRNDTVGHPTRRGQANCNNQAYIQIVQMSMSRQGFNYATYRAVNDYKFEEKYVNLTKCIKEQSESVLSILREICVSLDDEWKQYSERFRGKEMRKLFENFDYAREKALEGGVGPEFGMGVAKTIVQSCKEALNERYGDWKNKDSFRHEIEGIDEIFMLLNEPKGMLSERINHYLTEMLFIKLGNLEKYSEEIDEEFKIE